MTNFAENLSILRRRAGYTQESLAEALGVSRQAVGKWESEQTLPEAATLITLADLLGCTLDQLVRGEVPEETPAPAVFDPEAAGQAVYAAYHAHVGKFARSVALGVFLILMGLALTALTGALSLPEALTVGVFFLFLVAAVFLFIMAGMEDEDFSKAHPDIPLLFDPMEHQEFQKRFRVGIALCVAGILVDVALCGILGSMDWSDNGLEMYLGAGFLGILAFCVGPIVYLGCLSRRYELERARKKKPDLSGAIMLLATAGFLIWGLVWDGWKVSWVCFLIGAALCAVEEQVRKGS